MRKSWRWRPCTKKPRIKLLSPKAWRAVKPLTRDIPSKISDEPFPTSTKPHASRYWSASRTIYTKCNLRRKMKLRRWRNRARLPGVCAARLVPEGRLGAFWLSVKRPITLPAVCKRSQPKLFWQKTIWKMTSRSCAPKRQKSAKKKPRIVKRKSRKKPVEPRLKWRPKLPQKKKKLPTKSLLQREGQVREGALRPGQQKRILWRREAKLQLQQAGLHPRAAKETKNARTERL
mmetsp:Transcript_46073/g.74234  ORF Transcript_46073/g.74234 Transcript_46073/m.74234 type:complete len:232 (+) Transcript_46073:330-1025(+)